MSILTPMRMFLNRWWPLRRMARQIDRQSSPLRSLKLLASVLNLYAYIHLGKFINQLLLVQLGRDPTQKKKKKLSFALLRIKHQKERYFSIFYHPVRLKFIIHEQKKVDQIRTSDCTVPACATLALHAAPLVYYYAFPIIGQEERFCFQMKMMANFFGLFLLSVESENYYFLNHLHSTAFCWSNTVLVSSLSFSPSPQHPPRAQILQQIRKRIDPKRLLTGI